ncbi:unnamed protein product [Urochloa humidicola]
MIDGNGKPCNASEVGVCTAVDRILDGSDDQLALKDSLGAVRNAVQAAARIQKAFLVFSFKKKQEAVEVSHGIIEKAALSIQKNFRSWIKQKEFLNFQKNIIKIQVIVAGDFLCNPSHSSYAMPFADVKVPVEIIQQRAICCHTPYLHAGKMKMCSIDGNGKFCSEAREFEFPEKPTRNMIDGNGKLCHASKVGTCSAVDEIWDKSTFVHGGSDDQLALKHSLGAVHNAVQAAARIQTAYHVFSLTNKKVRKETLTIAWTLPPPRSASQRSIAARPARPSAPNRPPDLGSPPPPRGGFVALPILLSTVQSCGLWS